MASEDIYLDGTPDDDSLSGGDDNREAPAGAGRCAGAMVPLRRRRGRARGILFPRKGRVNCGPTHPPSTPPVGA